MQRAFGECGKKHRSAAHKPGPRPIPGVSFLVVTRALQAIPLIGAPLVIGVNAVGFGAVLLTRLGLSVYVPKRDVELLWEIVS